MISYRTRPKRILPYKKLAGSLSCDSHWRRKELERDSSTVGEPRPTNTMPGYGPVPVREWGQLNNPSIEGIPKMDVPQPRTEFQIKQDEARQLFQGKKQASPPVPYLLQSNRLAARAAARHKDQVSVTEGKKTYSPAPFRLAGGADPPTPGTTSNSVAPRRWTIRENIPSSKKEALTPVSIPNIDQSRSRSHQAQPPAQTERRKAIPIIPRRCPRPPPPRYSRDPEPESKSSSPRKAACRCTTQNIKQDIIEGESDDNTSRPTSSFFRSPRKESICVSVDTGSYRSPGVSLRTSPTERMATACRRGSPSFLPILPDYRLEAGADGSAELASADVVTFDSGSVNAGRQMEAALQQKEYNKAMAQLSSTPTLRTAWDVCRYGGLGPKLIANITQISADEYHAVPDLDNSKCFEVMSMFVRPDDGNYWRRDEFVYVGSLKQMMDNSLTSARHWASLTREHRTKLIPEYSYHTSRGRTDVHVSLSSLELLENELSNVRRGEIYLKNAKYTDTQSLLTNRRVCIVTSAVIASSLTVTVDSPDQLGRKRSNTPLRMKTSRPTPVAFRMGEFAYDPHSSTLCTLMPTKLPHPSKVLFRVPK